MQNIRRLPAVLFALILLLTMTLYPACAAAGAREGLLLTAKTILPALFPFFAASALLTRTGASCVLGHLCARPFRVLFGLPGAAAVALVTGLLGGYPVGVQTTVALYRNGELTREQAEQLLSFANCSGPAFLVGVCGAALCSSRRIGLLLYAIHAAAALLTGIALTRSQPSAPMPSSRTAPDPPESFSAAFVGAIADATAVSLKVTAFIVFFSVLLALGTVLGILPLLSRLLSPLLPLLGFPPSVALPFSSGIFELTIGLSQLPALPNRVILPLMSLLIGFGGISVHGQAAALTAGSGISLAPHFRGKILHALISYAIATAWCAVWPQSITVFAGGTVTAVHMTYPLLFLFLIAVFVKKTGKSHRRAV